MAELLLHGLESTFLSLSKYNAFTSNMAHNSLKNRGSTKRQTKSPLHSLYLYSHPLQRNNSINNINDIHYEFN